MNRLQRTRRAIYRRVPAWIRHHDFEVLVTILCLSAGIPLLFTDEVDATSVNATLPKLLVLAWSVILAFAPIAVIIGLWQASRRKMADSTLWMRIEAWGLRALAYIGYIYWFAIIVVHHLDAFPATQIVLIFAATCHSRATGQIIKVEDYLADLGTPHAKP
jgi:hypothetical protein